jgi:glucose/arabinose dehydrogenase
VVWKKTTPPSGITFYNGDMFPDLKQNLFGATLRSEALIRTKLEVAKTGYRVAGMERWFASSDDV